MANTTTSSSDATTTSAASADTLTLPATISLDVPSSGVVGESPTLQVAIDTDTVLTGGDGNDILVGGSGNDNLDAGEGDDILIGGGGSNTHQGGDGEDIFGHAAGASDTVIDFSVEDDKLSVSEGLTVTSTAQGTVQVDQGTGATDQAAQIITFSDGSTLALVGVTEEFSTDWLTGGASA
ncbi:MAG: hypothetical protein H7Y60_02385 [Rhodospirillaceae bacterium]|nr:hypothetical protein [Rhodospirillales bacterium]